MFSNMLNSVLEKNHEEMFEMHFKHEIMEHNLSRKKTQFTTAQHLKDTLLIIMASEDPKYRIWLDKYSDFQGSRLEYKMNFWGEKKDVPTGHIFNNSEEMHEAQLKHR